MKQPQPSQPTTPRQAAADRVVRKRLADGTIKEYRYPREGVAKPTAPRWAADSVNAMLMAYTHSPEWGELAKVTQRQAQLYLDPLWKMGHYRISDLRRKEVIQVRNGIYTGRGPEAANSYIKAGKAAFRWGIANEWAETSPFDNIERLKGGVFPEWSDEQAEAALDGLPEPLRRVVYLGAYTSQRRSDLISMTWPQVAGGVLHLTQQKTGMEVTMPLHPILAKQMQAWRAEATLRNGKDAAFVLTTSRGTRWTGQGLSQAMKRALNMLGIHGINVHGLRKLAARRLAEAGCTTHEIMAVGGWKTLGQVQHYTDKADRTKLAKAAVTRLRRR